jgi:hypothetical protein
VTADSARGRNASPAHALSRQHYNHGMSLPDPEPLPQRLIHRSGLFIISSQLDGLCTALRHGVPYGAEPGAGTRALLKKLFDDYFALATKRQLAGFPPIDESLNAMDVFAIAETLRATVLAFLTPDELAERKQALGFATPTLQDAVDDGMVSDVTEAGDGKTSRRT